MLSLSRTSMQFTCACLFSANGLLFSTQKNVLSSKCLIFFCWNVEITKLDAKKELKYQLNLWSLKRNNTGRCGQQKTNGKPIFLFGVKDREGHLSKEKMLLIAYTTSCPALVTYLGRIHSLPTPLPPPPPFLFLFRKMWVKRLLCGKREAISHTF